MRHPVIVRIALMVPLALFAMASPVFAQKLFNQAKALAGGVSTGDAPGFPVTLSKAGTYKLTGNLTVPDKDTTAIEVTASNVTLDLNGFSIFGPGEPGGGSGIHSSASLRNITVMNGSVRGMGNDGVNLEGGLHRVERVHATENRAGITVGYSSLVIGCTAGHNRDNGISARASSVVRESTTVANNYGIVVGSGCTVLGNTSFSNTSYGLFAWEAGKGVGYLQNVFEDNNGGGAQVSGGVQMGGNVCGTALCP